jgi:uncharacterized protein YfaA (DUF2138 family)
MAGKEMLAALAQPGDATLRTTAQMLLPARLKALSKYPAYRLALPVAGQPQSGWQRVEWRSPNESR